MPHLDYGDVIHDQPEYESFISKIESVHYNASLAITGGIKGTSQENLYQELVCNLSEAEDGEAVCAIFTK